MFVLLSQGHRLENVLGPQRQHFVQKIAKDFHKDMPWFHSKITRQESEKVISQARHSDGKYLYVVLWKLIKYMNIFRASHNSKECEKIVVILIILLHNKTLQYVWNKSLHISFMLEEFGIKLMVHLCWASVSITTQSTTWSGERKVKLDLETTATPLRMDPSLTI